MLAARRTLLVLLLCAFAGRDAHAQLTWPPKLPGGKAVVSTHSPNLLKAPVELDKGVTIAKTAPEVEMLYYPVQTYEGHPWSVWGDSVAVNGKYYSAIGDHLAPAGNAYVFEYDPQTRSIRTLCDLASTLKRPEGDYSPAKIHTRVDMGSDGWIYFGTHRGSTRVTTDQYHYQGDWIIRTNPKLNKTEIVVKAPSGKQCIPTGMVDPQRLIFYGGTAAANPKEKNVMFFAYDLKNHKLLYSGPDGPYRYLLFAKSTGRVYFTPSDDAPLRRYDPAVGGTPVQLDVTVGLRCASQETPQGIVYTSSHDGELFAFDTKTEKAKALGSLPVAGQRYVATLDADPTGRYLTIARAPTAVRTATARRSSNTTRRPSAARCWPSWRRRCKRSSATRPSAPTAWPLIPPATSSTSPGTATGPGPTSEARWASIRAR